MNEQRAPGELVGNAAPVDARNAVKIEERAHSARTPAQLYSIWRDFQQLPAYVSDIESDGTDMRIVIDYEPPAGTLSLMLDKFTRLVGLAPEFQIKADLAPFRQKAEAGRAPG